MLWLTKITRSEMGIYLCIGELKIYFAAALILHIRFNDFCRFSLVVLASNQIPPSVSKRIKLQIHCKY